MVLVHVSLNYTSCYESQVLNLGAKVKSAMFNLLDNIGQTVRTVNVHKLGLLVNEGLVTLRTEYIPNLGQLIGQANNGTGLNVKVTGIIPCTYSQTGYVLIWFVLGTRGIAHTVTVMLLIVGWSLDGIVHVRTSVPYSVCLVNQHVVHLDGQPNIHCIMPLALIYVLVYGERIGLNAVILYIIGTRLIYCTKIAPGIVVSVIEYSPLLYGRFKCQGMTAIGIYTEHLGFRINLVITVQFNHSHLLLGRCITYLRESYIGFTNPTCVGSWLNIPLQHCSGLTCRKE